MLLNLYYNLEAVLKGFFQDGIIFLDSSVIIPKMSLLELIRVDPFSRDKFLYLKNVNLKLFRFFLERDNYFILPGVQEELNFGLIKAEEKQKELLLQYGDRRLKHISATLYHHRELVDSFNVVDFRNLIERNSDLIEVSDIEIQQDELITEITRQVPLKNGRVVSRTDVSQVVSAMQIAKYTGINTVNVSADTSDFGRIYQLIQTNYENLGFRNLGNYNLVNFSKYGKNIEIIN